MFRHIPRDQGWHTHDYHACKYCKTQAGLFNTRLLVPHPGYEYVPGRRPVPDWTLKKPGLLRAVQRRILYWMPQGRTSSLGFSKLPYEVLDQIYRELCGFEISATRLVCKEWEYASRPFFAKQFLEHTMFWITSSHLRLLTRLTNAFGSYLKTIRIVPVRFTVRGFMHALRTYLHYRRAPAAGSRNSIPLRRHRTGATLATGDEIRLAGWSRYFSDPAAFYFGSWTGSTGLERAGWRIYHDRRRALPFLMSFALGVMSQAWLRLLRLDAARLAAALRPLRDDCDIRVEEVEFGPHSLHHNVEALGKAAPGWALELATFCAGDRWLYDEEYHRHVEATVALAVSASR